jgi:predicted  nucleic acid-binding Zn-ribbon protein
MTTADIRAGREKLDSLARQIASQLSATSPVRAPSTTRPTIGRHPAATAVRPELAAALDAIARAADLMGARQEQITVSERRAQDFADRIETLARQLADTEGRLRAAQDEAQRERLRAEDLERRSAELLEKTQGMLTEASERLLAAERRAEQSEDGLNQLQSFILERLRF